MPPIYAKSSIGERAAISATHAVTSTNASCGQETTWPRAVRERTQATKEDRPKKVIHILNKTGREIQDKRDPRNSLP